MISSTNNRNNVAEVDSTFTFPVRAVKSGQDNVITVIQVGNFFRFIYLNQAIHFQDNMGLDEDESGNSVLCCASLSNSFLHISDVSETIKSPRGIRGYKLNNGTFTTWKVQGKVGGYNGLIKFLYSYINQR